MLTAVTNESPDFTFEAAIEGASKRQQLAMTVTEQPRN
jgi:hypothetical protein